MHGYQLMQEIGRHQGLTVKPGTLYPLLNRLELRGLIVGKWQISSRPTKTYGITAEGLKYLQEARAFASRLIAPRSRRRHRLSSVKGAA